MSFGLQPFYQVRQVHEVNPHAFDLSGEGPVDIVSEDDLIRIRMTAVKGREIPSVIRISSEKTGITN